MAASGEDMSCWEKITTFDEFQKCMIDYIDGKEEETPWMGAPLADETVKATGLLDNLRRVNAMGFVTIEGQPGTISEIQHYKTGENLEEIQRGYLEGFLQKGKYDLDKLTEYLNESNVYVIIVGVNVDKETEDVTYDILKNSCPDGENCYEKKFLPLTWYVSLDNPDKPIDYYSNKHNDCVSELKFMAEDNYYHSKPYESLHNMLINDTITLSVVNMTPGELNLEEKLLDAFSKSMLPKRGGRRKKRRKSRKQKKNKKNKKTQKKRKSRRRRNTKKRSRKN